MFAKPRPKKSPLPPPSKKRRTEPTIEEISFDNGARQEYLTGFHKRKQQRIKHAQSEAAKKARQEKLETRRQMREERRRDAEKHVERVNEMLREAGAYGDDRIEVGHQVLEGEAEPDNWEGFPDKPNVDIVDLEEEYVDEDRYTTVTVESVSVSREGFGKTRSREEDALNGHKGNHAQAADDNHKRTVPVAGNDSGTKPSRPKLKKKKFRYESKHERQITDRAQRARSKARRFG